MGGMYLVVGSREDASLIVSQGMEELIKQAFVHVDGIGRQVQQGQYDLIGPDGEIILPAVWEKVVEPDWSITMQMWPMERPPPAAQMVGPDGKPLPPHIAEAMMRRAQAAGGQRMGPRPGGPPQPGAQGMPPPPPLGFARGGGPPPHPMVRPGMVPVGVVPVKDKKGHKPKTSTTGMFSLFGPAPVKKKK